MNQKNMKMMRVDGNALFEMTPIFIELGKY
jgi:hypothetical protein